MLVARHSPINAVFNCGRGAILHGLCGERHRMDKTIKPDENSQNPHDGISTIVKVER